MTIKRMEFCLFILIFIKIWSGHCIIVNYREINNVKMEPFHRQLFKRDMTQFFDKAAYAFNGLEKVDSIPARFPIDICPMNLDGTRYAAVLHIGPNNTRHFMILRMQNSNYDRIMHKPTPLAISLDCKSLGDKGYVALAYNITTPIGRAQDGSPIYEISGTRVRAVQYFASTNLLSVVLRITGNDFFLLQTFQNTRTTPHLDCPYFLWSGSTFNKVGDIPCSNARHLEPFSIEYEHYVAVANYADQRGRTSTNSEIYKFIRAQRKFELIQKIKTYGAIDVRHFRVPIDEIRKQNFLVFGNTVNPRNSNAQLADSVFYTFDKGEFVPYQSLPFFAVEKFQPVQNTDAEKFLLLVACTNQDIKIYNLNDWKFEESNTQFTEGAFSRGVSNMRVYQEKDDTFLVIANELMLENDTNIFRPIFKQDEHANALRQQIIDWAKTETQRLASIDVPKLMTDVDAKLKQLQPRNELTVNASVIAKSDIQTVDTTNLIYPRLHMTNNYWQALSYANQALDILENQLLPTKTRLKRTTSTTFKEYEIFEFNKNLYDHQELQVGTLVVKNKMTAERINGVNATRPVFEKVTAKKVIVTGSYKSNTSNRYRMTPNNTEDATRFDENVKAPEITITGTINGYTWDHLVWNTLKSKGDEKILTPIKLNSLKASTVIVQNDEVNEQDLGKLISINGGNYTLQHGMKFTKNVSFDKIIVKERLNNIKVEDGKLDVLLRRTNEPQVVEGLKTFESFKVGSSIIMSSGRMGKQLRLISPHKTIYDNLILQGDYVIDGDVTISKQLKSNDIIDTNSNTSVTNILNNALRVDHPLTNVNLEFAQPLDVNNSLVSFINGEDLQHLLRTNVNEIQLVAGEKVFMNGLNVTEGLCEVKELNGHNLESLQESLLLKHTNQTIEVPMQLGKILAKSVQATNITLGGNQISNYLTNSGNQTIQGELIVQTLYAKDVQFEYLHTKGKIFNAPISSIYQHRLKQTPKPSIFKRAQKFSGNIYVDNLYVNTTINGKSVHEIEQQLNALHGDIKYVGNFKINYDMNISNLIFHGTLNDITADDFGRCWLQKMGEQEFTAPQTLAEVNSENGVHLQGALNGHEIIDFYNNVYWINRDEYIENAVFENPIHMQSTLRSQTVNDIRVPDDLLHASAAQPQIVDAPIIVEQNLYVNGQILNTSTLNGIDLSAFERYLNGDKVDTLHVENAYFTSAPQYKTLNRHDLKRTLNNVWLSNEDVLLERHVEIANASFEGLLEFEGPINNVNLQYVKDNYFSLTRPQQIENEIVFENIVKFENDADIENMKVLGLINDTRSSQQFNFNEFVSYTLKTAGPHEITGNWRLAAANVDGNLQNVLVNNLNLVNDVLHLNAPNMEITAPKYTSNAFIENLYVTPASRVNDVNMAAWVRNTVYVYENHTIYGTTTLDSVNLYNNLNVLGLVNNITYNPENLLLRTRNDQVVRGSVLIRNQFPHEQRILVNSIDNLQTTRVNGQELRPFFDNQAKLTASNVSEFAGHLIFDKPLLVEKYLHERDVGSATDRRKRNNRNDATTRRSMEDVIIDLTDTFAEPFYVLDDFEIHQTLPVQAYSSSYFAIEEFNELTDIVGIKDLNGYMKYYSFNRDKEQFELYDSLYWLTAKTLNIIYYRDVINNAKFLKMKLPDKDETKRVNDELLKIDPDLDHYINNITASHLKIQSFKSDNFTCLPFYATTAALNLTVRCFSARPNIANNNFNQTFVKYTIKQDDIKQILPIGDADNLLLRLNHSVQVWHFDNGQKKMGALKTIEMAIGRINNITIVAVIGGGFETEPVIDFGFVDVYKFTDGRLVSIQTLRVDSPRRLLFTYFEKTNELFLHVITSFVRYSWVNFQYRGAMGFDQVAESFTVPRVYDLDFIHLHAAHQDYLTLFERSKKVHFLKAVYKRF